MLSWTTATINNNDAIRQKNVPWNWLRPSIRMMAKKRRGGGIGVGNDNDAPGFAVG